MKRLSGFSLMEMMVVLLIVSLVAAASAPMINKKLLTAASEKSPWVWTGLDNSIAYNLNGSGSTAVIGAVRTGVNPSAYLHIKSSNSTRPQLTLESQTGDSVKVFNANNSIGITSEDLQSISSNSVVLGGNTTISDWENSVLIGANSKISSTTQKGNATIIGANSSGAHNSVAIGAFSHAAVNGIGIGASANARTANAIAVGYNSNAVGGAISIGNESNTTKASSIAIGSGANVDGLQGIAIGTNVQALTRGSVALGARAIADGQESIAILGHTQGLRAISIGDTSGTGNYSTAIGYGVGASNQYSVGLGYLSYATGFKTVAIGSQAGASQKDAIAIGNNSTASGESSIAIGSHQTGGNTTASGASSIAIGDGAKALHEGSAAIGWAAETTSKYQVVLGNKDSTVYIPGNLVVDKYTVLARESGEVLLRTQPGPPDEDSKYTTSRMSRIFMGDDKGGDDNTRTLDKYGWEIEVGGFNITSDIRLKNVGKAFIGGLKEIKQLETFNYTFKKDPNKTPRVGVMAQDLQKIFPQAVFKGEDGFLRIRMEDMFYALINAVKELDLKFASQDKKIEELTKENQELKKTVATLEKRLEKIEKSLKNSK